MGLFSKLFGSASGSGAYTDSAEETDSCQECGEEYPVSELDDNDICEGCANDDGTRYCCGLMYTDGESECFSCGEWLHPKD